MTLWGGGMARGARLGWGDGALVGLAVRLLAGGLLAGNALGLIAVAAGWLMGGTRAALSALLAMGLVLAFFSVGQGVQVLVARRRPSQILAAAMASYIARVVGLGILLWWALPAAGSGRVDPTWLFAGLMVTIVGWLGGEIATFIRHPLPVYDVEYTPPTGDGGGL